MAQEQDRPVYCSVDSSAASSRHDDDAIVVEGATMSDPIPGQGPGPDQKSVDDESDDAAAGNDRIIGKEEPPSAFRADAIPPQSCDRGTLPPKNGPTQ